MNNIPNIKIVRLQTGEDIISSIIEDEESDMLLLNNPMRMIVRRLETGKSIFMMIPWLPIEVIKEDCAMIYNSDIITMIEPKDSLVEYYQNIVNESVLSFLEQNELSFGEEFDEDELTEEDLEEVQEYKRNNLLH